MISMWFLPMCKNLRAEAVLVLPALFSTSVATCHIVHPTYYLAWSASILHVETDSTRYDCRMQGPLHVQPGFGQTKFDWMI